LAPIFLEPLFRGLPREGIKGEPRNGALRLKGGKTSLAHTWVQEARERIFPRKFWGVLGAPFGGFVGDALEHRILGQTISLKSGGPGLG